MVSKEKWVDIPIDGVTHKYKISNLGRVYSNKMMKVMSLKVHHKGYLKAQIFKDGKNSTHFVHRLVALAFIENPFGYSQVNHKDGNKTNNDVSNLEWCSNSMNIKHAHRIGLMSNKGDCHPRAKLNSTQVLEIRELFKIGKTRKMLATQFGTKPSNIKDIVLRKSWSHI